MHRSGRPDAAKASASPDRTMRLVFLGPPGAGKGTQCRRLAEHLQIPHLSTGEWLRQAIQDRSPAGRLAEQFISAGKLAPDSLMIAMVGDWLARPDARSGVLFDGFPRTVPQAEALDGFLAQRGLALDAVLELMLDDAAVRQRLASRHRGDDQPEVIAHRLQEYREQTQPLLDYYRQQGLLETIDGAGTTDDVFQRLVQAVDHRNRRA